MAVTQSAALTAPPEQGQLAEVRQRRYIATEVVRSAAIGPSRNGEPVQHLVSLTSVDDEGLGEELQVIWELEPGARVHEKLALPEPTGFDDPARLDAFLDAVRWGAASVADTRLLQSPFRAGIDIEDYQLDPLVRAIQMPRVNLLVADDVGLGKTIEAGLVVLELILRHRARRILIVCPASLQIQWQQQMRDKFGLEFRIVDSDLMKQLRRTRGLRVNPWNHYPRLITSIDFLKRERPLRLFREVLPQGSERAYPRKFDVLIIDEAHNVAPSGRGRYATDSLRTAAIRTSAPHFEHKLFLTATPHNGYQESFTALLELLDNQRFARGVPPDREQLGAVMVRRLKTEILKWDGSPRFPSREPLPIEVPYTDEEKEIHNLLKRYTRLRLEQASGSAERYAAEFVLKLLKKRLFSSPAAFADTLAKHEQAVRRLRKFPVTKPSLATLLREADRLDEEYADDRELEASTEEAVEAATLAFSQLSTEEEQLLARLRSWAEKARFRPDSKASELIQWLRDNVRPNGQWSDERVIIFTEYRATQKWLEGILATEGLTGGDRLMTLYGGMDSQQRERVKAAFQYDPHGSPVRILLATDAASEGIDLQNHCHQLIHYEIPWNPNRMEQRNGRIDRHGQRAQKVLVYHFAPAGFARRQQDPTAKPSELEADLEFLMRAAIKINTIREDLGKVGPIIAQQVEEAMLGRRSALDTTEAERQAGPIKRLLRLERNLREEIERHMSQLHETRNELRLSPENIQSVVEIALELAGQPRLIPAKVPGIWPDPIGQRKHCPVFLLPQFAGSWAACAEGLRHPHTQQVRPIVFDPDLARGRDDVVLAHLNHKLVQMCLRLLRAEVWAPEGKKKIHRVSARLAPDQALEAPAVVAHARLLFVSGDSQRLHEELLVAGGLVREGRFSRLGVTQLQSALAAARPDEPPPALKDRFRELWLHLAEPLYQALEARTQERTAAVQKQLGERAEKEVKKFTAIMQELERDIREELESTKHKQLELFPEEEWEQLKEQREQFDRDVDSLRARLLAIPGELAREVEHIRKRFADPQPRLFPVAVTFLVPARLAQGTPR